MLSRFTEDGSNLDLCYISDRIIVMGNFYTNDSLSDVRNLLSSKHSNHYRVYNLASEPEYNIEQDLDDVVNFPFNAMNPCALPVLVAFVENAQLYLNAHSSNVIAIHCKTGTGQSCFFAASVLLYTGVCASANASVEYVNNKRSPAGLQALSVPSQIRYVHYYEALLRSPHVNCSTFRITHVRITTVPSASASLIDCGCAPHLSISVLARHRREEEELLINSAMSAHQQHDLNISNPMNFVDMPPVMNSVAWYPRRVYNQLDHMPFGKQLRFYSSNPVAGKDHIMEFPLESHKVAVRGDVCLGLFSEGEKLCQLYFNTAFIQDNGYLSFDKERIDVAHADTLHYTFHPLFQIELLFQPVPDDPSLNFIEDKSPITNTNGASNRSTVPRLKQRNDAPPDDIGATTAASISGDIDFMLSYGDTNLEYIN